MPKESPLEKGSPLETIESLVQARSALDIETATRLYEEQAVIVTTSMAVQHSAEALQDFLQSFAAMRPVFDVMRREIIEANGIALHCSAWTLQGVDPTGQPFKVSGRSADVLRKQASGEWLVVIDNPWGTGLLGNEEAQG